MIDLHHARRTLQAVACALVLSACGDDAPEALAGADAAGADTAADASAPDVAPAPDATARPATPDTPVAPEAAGPPPPLLLIEETFPKQGRVAGGETVAIVGYGFEPGVQVLFDGSLGTGLVFIHEQRVHITTPPHSPGPVDVTVILSDGRATSFEGGFLYYNEVQVESVSPSSGGAEGGSPVTVRGAGFVPDSVLLFGHHKALAIQVVDDRTLLALSPPGDLGYAGVTVSNGLGVHRLKAGYKYTGAVAIDVVLPAAGPLAGGQDVEIRGAGFEEPLVVWFGSTPAPFVQRIDDDLLLAETPPSGAGVVAVRVDSGQGTAIAPAGYLYYAPSTPAGPKIVHVAPAEGELVGGTLVALALDGPLDAAPEDLQVTFGGAAGDVLEVAPSVGSVLVATPPGAQAGLVDVTLTASAGASPAPQAFEYLTPLVVESATPAQGPVDGGTEVILTGAGFGPAPAVFVGALMAPVVEVLGPGQLRIITPTGSPGLANVRVVVGPREGALEDGFHYVPDATELYVVLPDHGAIAGGTWVQVIGAGFAEGSSVEVAGVAATDVQYLAPGLLTARTPPGAIGTVDVAVQDDAGDADAVLSAGYTYYDPKSTFGGTWGDAVDTAVNVTVLDGVDAKPVDAAFAILDNDPATPYQGLTNDVGQITFSGPDIASGAHTISVSKEGYVTYSVVHFDAENVTIFLKRLEQPEPGDGPTIAPGIVNGKVVGLGKYVVGPPGPCTEDPFVFPLHCKPCEEQSECGGPDSGAVCHDLNNGEDSWRCLVSCESDDECPAKNACQLIAGQKHCVPTPGQKVAICSATKPYFRFFDVPLGPGAMADEDGDFGILAYPTQVAVVCFGGFWLKSYEPTSEALENAIQGNPQNTFRPVAMGVVRNVLLGPGVAATGIEVELNIPLNRTVHARMEKPPLEDTDYLWLRTYLDLGDDGVIKLPVQRTLYDDEPFTQDTMPTQLAGPIADASYIFYGGANSYKNEVGYYYPKAWVVRQGVIEPQDDRMLRMVEGTWGTEPTGLTESLLASHAFAEDLVFAVGTGGKAYKYVGSQHLGMPTPTQKTLRGVHGQAPDSLWAVGDDGKILRFEGVVWKDEDSPTSKDLESVVSYADGTARAVGSQVILKRGAEGAWAVEPAPLAAWRDIDATGPSDTWVVGFAGTAARHDGTSWQQVGVPTVQGLRAVAAIAPDDVWIAGEAGTLLHWNGAGFTLIDPPTTSTLNDLAWRSSTEVLAVGREAAVVAWDGTAWVQAPPVGDYGQDLHAASLPAGSTAAYTFGDHHLILGPIVGPSRVSVPEAGGLMTEDALQWTADERVVPHYQHVEIYIPGLMQPILIWELIVDGHVGTAALPDFAALQGTPGLMQGLHFLSITRTYQEGFDIDQFDYTDLGSLDRQSWAIEFFPFTTPTDGGEP